MKRDMKRIFVILCAALLAGCAADVHQTAASGASATGGRVKARQDIVVTIAPYPGVESTPDYTQVAQMLQSNVISKLRATLPGAHVDGMLQPGKTEATTVQIQVMNYRFANIGKRFIPFHSSQAALGVHVTVVDQPSGEVQAEVTLDTASHAANGIAATTTDTQVEAVADNIARLVRGGGGPSSAAY